MIAMSLAPPRLPAFFADAAPHRLAVMQALWPAIAGERLANHTEVVGLQREVLRIRADSTQWLRTVRDLKEKLALRLRAAAGPLAPRALAFVEGPLSATPPRRARPTPPKAAVDIDTLPAELREAADRLPTPEARDACLRAIAAYRARFGSARHL